MYKAKCKYCGEDMLFLRANRITDTGRSEANACYKCVACGAQSPETGWMSLHTAREHATKLAGAIEVKEE